MLSGQPGGKIYPEIRSAGDSYCRYFVKTNFNRERATQHDAKVVFIDLIAAGEYTPEDEANNKSFSQQYQTTSILAR